MLLGKMYDLSLNVVRATLTGITVTLHVTRYCDWKMMVVNLYYMAGVLCLGSVLSFSALVFHSHSYRSILCMPLLLEYHVFLQNMMSNSKLRCTYLVSMHYTCLVIAKENDVQNSLTLVSCDSRNELFLCILCNHNVPIDLEDAFQTDHL